jgi:hypothetical protein
MGGGGVDECGERFRTDMALELFCLISPCCSVFYYACDCE